MLIRYKWQDSHRSKKSEQQSPNITHSISQKQVLGIPLQAPLVLLQHPVYPALAQLPTVQGTFKTYDDNKNMFIDKLMTIHSINGIVIIILCDLLTGGTMVVVVLPVVLPEIIMRTEKCFLV